MRLVRFRLGPNARDTEGDVVGIRGNAMGALDGIRVLDAGLLVQGPQAAQTMGDMGADIIKIELPGFGDQGRWIPTQPGDPRSPYYIGVNRGKRSVTIDLRTADGAAVFMDLVETADVVISNFKHGTLAEWGVGYEQASERNPRIIYGMGSTFGTAGPGARREGADIAAQAAGGLMSTTGADGSPPTPVGVTIADHIGSQNMTAGVLAALFARERTGRGQRVDVSLFGSQLYAQAPEYTSYFLSGNMPGRSNGGHPLINATYGIVQTADGWLALVGVPPAQRNAFYETIGRPDLIEDERFRSYGMTPADRQKLFKEELTPIFKTETTATWGERLEAAGCRWAAVNDYATAAADPHAALNGYVQTINHPEWGETMMIGSPIAMSDTPVSPGDIAPELGQHTEEVLLELGYSWDRLSTLRQSGAI